MLIGVMSCLANPVSSVPMPDRTLLDHTKRWTSIRETWGVSADYRIFYGGKRENPWEDEVSLPCEDSYYHTAFKVREMCRWALDNKYDSLFKVDDDTYVRPERLDSAGFEQFDFVCRVLPPTDENHPMPYAYGGCGYYVGKKLLEIAANDTSPISKPDGSPMDRCNTYEDGWIAKVAQYSGIELIDDHRLRALRHGGDFEGHPWELESPNRRNDCIAVCEFPEEYMYKVHNHFLTM